MIIQVQSKTEGEDEGFLTSRSGTIPSLQSLSRRKSRKLQSVVPANLTLFMPFAFEMEYNTSFFRMAMRVLLVASALPLDGVS